MAQIQLMDLLLERSKLAPGSTVLDVGCGIGGTSRYLAQKYECAVTGITISGRQVEMAKSLTAKAATTGPDNVDGIGKPVDEAGFHALNKGKARYIELDAEKMGEYFKNPPNQATFDGVWISEAMSHLPDKKLFFQNAFAVLNSVGKLAVADWFKAEGLTDAQMEADIKPIEGQASLRP